MLMLLLLVVAEFGGDEFRELIIAQIIEMYAVNEQGPIKRGGRGEHDIHIQTTNVASFRSQLRKEWRMYLFAKHSTEQPIEIVRTIVNCVEDSLLFGSQRVSAPMG